VNGASFECRRLRQFGVETVLSGHKAKDTERWRVIPARAALLDQRALAGGDAVAPPVRMPVGDRGGDLLAQRGLVDLLLAGEPVGDPAVAARLDACVHRRLAHVELPAHLAISESPLRNLPEDLYCPELIEPVRMDCSAIKDTAAARLFRECACDALAYDRRLDRPGIRVRLSCSHRGGEAP